MTTRFIVLPLLIPILINCQYILVSQLMTQSHANAYCGSTYNTKLASIHSYADNSIVQSLCSAAGESLCWIGRHCQGSRNGQSITTMTDPCWVWYDGTAQDFGLYKTGYTVIEHIGTVINASDGNWEDWSPTSTFYFLCNSQYIRNSESLHYAAHEALCLFRYDSHLASIHSDTQNAQVLAMCDNCWFGLHDTYNEGGFEWIDSSVWDYGTDISGNDGSGPWEKSQPDNLWNEDCVHIRAAGWNDNSCSMRSYPGICNYPSLYYVFNDPLQYQRIPASSQIIGEMDVLDDVYIEFYIVINSFPASYTNILHIGNVDTEYMPGIWLYADTGLKQFHFSHSYATQHDNSVRSAAVETHILYHITYHIQQDHVRITLNDSIVSDVSAESHKIINANIYLSSAWVSAADVVVSGLKISSSNGNKPNAAYNYLCDFSNRFTILTGSWIVNGCNVSVQYSNSGGQVWLGDADKTTLQWTDYKIEAVIYYKNGTNTAGITFRTNADVQENGTLYLEGTTYNFFLNKASQKVQLATVVDGYNGASAWTLLISASFTIQNGGTYILRADISGQYIACYINHIFIGQVSDTAYSAGSVGLQQRQSNVVFLSLRIMFPNSNDFISVNPTASPTASPTNAVTYMPPNPTMSAMPDGSSGEQRERITTVQGDGSINNGWITDQYYLYIAISGGVLCCCLIVLLFARRSKKDKKYMGPTDLVEITSVSELRSDIQPIDADLSNENLPNNVIEDMMKIIEIENKKDNAQKDEQNVHVLNDQMKDFKTNDFETANGDNMHVTQMEVLTDSDGMDDGNKKGSAQTEGYNHNIGADEFIIEGSNDGIEEGTTMHKHGTEKADTVLYNK